jgi:hypothetical protein
MKQTFLALVLLLNFSFAATQMSVEDAQIFSEFYTYISKVPLPDGRSVFGNYAPGSRPFDFDHMNEDANPAYLTAVEMSRLLDTSSTAIKERKQQLNTIKESYDFLITELYRLNPSAIMFFERLLQKSELFAGVSVALPKQPERAALLNKLLGWRVFNEPKPTDALVAIRIERERLDAIARDEEANRKAEAEAKAPEQFRKAEPTSGLRRRHVHNSTTDDEHPTPTIKDPLLPVKAH